MVYICVYGLHVCVWFTLTLVKSEYEISCFQLFIVSNVAYDFHDVVILHILDAAIALFYYVYL